MLAKVRKAEACRWNATCGALHHAGVVDRADDRSARSRFMYAVGYR